MSSYFVMSVINGFVMISLAAIGLWAASSAVMEEPFTFSLIYSSAIAYYPAVLVMISISVLLIGFLPKLLSFVWFYLFYSFIVIYLGGIFQFSEWVGKISPYGHISRLPIEDFNYARFVFLLLIAVILAIAGFFGYKRRDVHG